MAAPGSVPSNACRQSLRSSSPTSSRDLRDSSAATRRPISSSPSKRGRRGGVSRGCSVGGGSGSHTATKRPCQYPLGIPVMYVEPHVAYEICSSATPRAPPVPHPSPTECGGGGPGVGVGGHGLLMSSPEIE